MHGELALLGILLGLVKCAGAGNLRQNYSRVSQVHRWMDRGINISQSRSLTGALQTCGEMHRDSQATWCISCGFSTGTCRAPACPSGMSAIESKDKCLINSQEAPHCEPWTHRVELRGNGWESVDNSYRLEIRAVGSDNLLSFSENRPVTIQLTGSSGSSQIWTSVTMRNGRGALDITHTVAEDIAFTMTGDDYGPSVTFESLGMTFVSGNMAKYKFKRDSTTGTVDSPVAVWVVAQDQYRNTVHPEERGVTITWRADVGEGVADQSEKILNLSPTAAACASTFQELDGTAVYELSVSGSTHEELDLACCKACSSRRECGFWIRQGQSSGPIQCFLRRYPTGNPYATGALHPMPRRGGFKAGGEGSAMVRAIRPGSYTIRLKDPVVQNADISDTTTVSLNFGVATRFRFQVVASDYTAGTTAALTIRAEDQYGNFVNTESRDVTVVVTSAAPCSFPAGNLTTFSNGRAPVQVECTNAEVITLSMEDTGETGLDVSHTINVRFIPGPVSGVMLIANPAYGTVDNPITVSLRAVDQHQNLVRTESRKVTVVLSGERVSGAGTKTFSQGSSTASISSQKAQIVQVSMTDDFSTGLDVSQTLSLVFAAGAPKKVLLSPAVQTATAQAPAVVNLTAVDQYENNALSSAEIIVRPSSPATVLNNGLVQLVDGQASVQVSCQRATDVEVQLSDQSGSQLDVSKTASIIFQAGTATKYVLSYVNGQTEASVDSTVPVQVTALDAWDNFCPTEQRGVSLAIFNGGGGDVAVSITNGLGIGQVGHTKPGSAKVIIKDTSSTGLNVNSDLLVSFTPGRARSVGFSTGFATTGTVDQPLEIGLAAMDQYGNTAISTPKFFMDLTITGLQVGRPFIGGTATVAFERGRATGFVTSERPQDVRVSLVAVDNTGLTLPTPLTLTFTAGAPARVTLTAPGSKIVGEFATVSVSSQDQYGNSVTQGSASVAVASTGDAVVSNSGIVQLVNGAGQVTVRNDKVETVTLSLSDPQNTGLDVSSTRSMSFLPAAAYQYAFVDTSIRGVSIDNQAQVKVEAQDRYGNFVPTYSGNVAIASTNLSSNVNVALASGRGTAGIGHTKAEEVEYTLASASAFGLAQFGTPMKIQWVAGTADSVTLETQQSTGTVDRALEVELKAWDRFGNHAPSEARKVEVFWDKGTEQATQTVQMAQGVGRASITRTKPGTVVVKMRDTFVTGLTVSATLSLDFAAGQMAIVLFAAPPSALAGDWTDVNLYCTDKYGNPVSAGPATSISVKASGSTEVANQGHVTLRNAMATLSIRSEKATTVTLSLEDRSDTGLDVSNTATLSFTAGAAARFGFAAWPDTTSVDDVAQVTVEAQDRFGNFVPTTSRDVSIASNKDNTWLLVDIVDGRGIAEVSYTIAEEVTYTLVDSQNTAFAVAGAEAKIKYLAGAPRSVVLSAVDETGGTVDAALPVVLRAFDRYGNFAPAEQRAVEVLWDDGISAAAKNAPFTNGQGQVPITRKRPGTFQVSMLDKFGTGLNVSSTLSLSFSTGAPAMVLLSAPSTALVGDRVRVSLSSADQYGNAVDEGSASISVNATGAAELDDYGQALLVNGAASVTVRCKKAEPVTLSLFDTHNSGLDVSSSQSVVFLPAPAVAFGFAEWPSKASVDTGAQVTVEAQDRFGNRDANYQNDVSIVSNRANNDATSRLLSAAQTILVAIEDGRGTVVLTQTAIQDVTYTLADTQNTNLSVAGASIKISFTPGAPRSVEIFADVTTGTVDDELPVTLKTLDRYGNLAPADNKTIEVHWDSGIQPPTYHSTMTFANGFGQVPVSRTKPGTAEVSMVDSSGLGLDVSGRVSLVFLVGAPRSIRLRMPGSGNAGADVNVKLITLDQYGNMANAAPTPPSVKLKATGAAVVSNNGLVQWTPPSAEASILLQSTKAEIVEVSMEDISSTGLDVSYNRSLVILGGAPARAEFAKTQEQASVEDVAQLPVEVFDAYGNIATGFEAAMGATANVPGVSLSGVPIHAGSGVLQVSHTTPGSVLLSLINAENTTLDVSGHKAQVTFTPGAVQKIAMNALSTTGTVDAPLQLELKAQDRFGNTVTSDTRAVTVQTSGGNVSGAGTVQLVSGQAALSISSRVPQTVQVSLASIQGVDVGAGQDLLFMVGSVYEFSMQSSSGTSSAVQKVGRSIPINLQALDQYGNLVSNGAEISLEAEIEPVPTEIASNKMQLSLSNGLGSTDLPSLGPGTFTVRIIGATSQRVATTVLESAVARSTVFQAEFRADLTPPDFKTLTRLETTMTSVEFRLSGLTEKADIWCIVSNRSSLPPETPTSTSDGAVFSALRGPGGNTWSSPSVRIPLTDSDVTAKILLTALVPGSSCVLRCAVADESGNQMAASNIIKHQLTFDVPRPSATGSASGGDEGGSNTGMIIGIIVAILVVLPLCCCVGFVVYKKRIKKDDGDFSKVVPAEDPKSDANDSPKGLENGSADNRPSATLAATPPPDAQAKGVNKSDTTDSDDEVVEVTKKTDEELLAEAMQMEQELLKELERRGGADADFDSSDDDSIGSDTSAVLRDVKNFLKERKSVAAPEEELVMPDLPLMLSEEDEARIAAMIALAQQGPSFQDRLDDFDSKWAGVDGVWEKTREAVRAQQVDFHNQIEASRSKLAAAREAVDKCPDSHEMDIIDGLAAQGEAFTKESSHQLVDVHQLAVEWPAEDAKLRDAVIEEWTPKIREASSKDERQHLRMEAVMALRQLDDDRENELDVKMEELEDRAAVAIEQLREAQAAKWRELCSAMDNEANALRKEVADLRVHFAHLVWQAEHAALQAALKLRRQIRDIAVENEGEREAARREEELVQHIAAISEVLQGDDEDVVALRERALKALDRSAVAARKKALEEKEARKRHWHEILEERGRERIKAAKRAYMDEERRLADETAAIEEDEKDVETLRRNGLLVGATHRAEVALLHITAATRRGRILMGLQATAAGSVAEERLPRKEKNKDSAKGPKDAGGSDATDPTMGATAMNWQVALQSATEELTNAIDHVVDAINVHSQRQKELLAQRQNREMLLVTEPEGDDEKREDLLDALEENLRTELRECRWHFSADEAEALAHRDDGAETELGRRMKTVARQSAQLKREDEIFEKYDRLRAFVIRGEQVSMGEIEEAQQEAKKLEEEAAQLLAEAAQDAEADSLGGDSDSAGDAEDGDGSSSKHGRRGQLRKRRSSLQRKVRELLEQGKMDEAFKLMEEAMKQEAEDSDAERDAAQDEAAKLAEAKRLEEEAKRAKRQEIREQALKKARDLEKAGRPAEATDVIKATLAEEGAASDSEWEPDMDKLRDAVVAGLENVDDSIKKDLEEQRAKLEERREERKKKRAEAQAEAKALQEQGKNKEAMDVLAASLAADIAGAQEERGLYDAALAAAEQARLKDALAAGLGAQGEQLADDLAAQRARMEARRAERQKARKQALQQGKEFSQTGWNDEAADVMQAALSDEGTASDADWDAEAKQLKDSLLSGVDDIDGRLAAELEAQRRRAEARRAERRRRREEAAAKAKALQEEGKSQEAAEVMAAALQEEIEASDNQPSLYDASKLKDAIIGQDAALAEELERQRARMEARRAARRKAREQALRQGKDVALTGRDGEAADIIKNVLAGEGTASDSDFDAEAAKLKEKLLAGANDLDGKLAAELEAQRKKLAARRAERRRRREEAAAKAKALQEQGKDKMAMEVLAAAMAEDMAAADQEPSLFDGSRLKDAMGGRDAALSDELAQQRARMEARRAARRKAREQALKDGKGMAAAGQAGEGAEAVKAALDDQGDASDNDWDAEAAKLKEKMLEGVNDVDGRLAAELEAQRQKLAARRAERRRRREEAKAKAKALQEQGKDEEAMEVLAAAMEEDLKAAQQEESLYDASKLKDAMSARNAALDDEVARQRARMEARRAKRQKNRNSALQQGKDLQQSGLAEDAAEALMTALADEGAASDAEWDAESERLRNALANADGSVAAELEAQRKKLEARRAERKRRRDEAAAKARKLQDEGKHEEAAEVLAAALEEDMAASEKDADPYDLPKLKDNLAERDAALAADAELQRKRMEARRAARQKRREQAHKKAQDLEKQGRLDEALDVLTSGIVEEGDTSDSDWGSALTESDRSKMRDKLASGFEDADKLIAEELEEQRLKAQRAREARKKRREDAAAKAKALQDQGQGLKAMEVLSTALEADAAAAEAEAELYEASVGGLDVAGLRGGLLSGVGAQASLLSAEEEAQRRKLEARRAARQKKRQEAKRAAEELEMEGKVDQAVDLIASAMAEEGDASDADSELERSQDHYMDAQTKEKLRQKMAAGIGGQDDVLSKEAEEQRLKAEARRAARKKKREEAQAKANALKEKGDHKAAKELLTTALEEEAVAGEASLDRSKLKDAFGKQDGALAGDAEAQRKRAEERRAQRQKKREEAQRKARELQAEGKTEEALEVMVASMNDEAEADLEADLADKQAANGNSKTPPRSPSPGAGAREKMKSKLAGGLGNQDEMLDEEQKAQRSKIDARRAARKKKREEAAELEDKAAKLRNDAGLSGGKTDEGEKTAPALDALRVWQGATQKKDLVGQAVKKSQEEAAKTLVADTSAVTDEEKSVLKDEFAAEIKRCEEAVSTERDKQRQKAQQRLEARKQKRKEAAAAKAAVKSQPMMKALKAHNAIKAASAITNRFQKKRAQVAKEHSDIEARVRQECEAEMKALEERLRREADERIAELKAQMQRRPPSRPDSPMSTHQEIMDDSVAAVQQAQAVINQEQERQAQRIKDRLAKRQKKLQKREANVRSKHCEEDVRLQLQHEREKLEKKTMSKVKGKELMKELYKVKGLIGKLQDNDGAPSSPNNASVQAKALQPETLPTPRGAPPPQPPDKVSSDPSLVVIDVGIEEEEV